MPENQNRYNPEISTLKVKLYEIISKKSFIEHLTHTGNEKNAHTF